MSNRWRIFLGISGVLIITLLALTFFFYYLITKSHPVTSGTVVLDDLKAPVAIHRDEYGIPHIFSESEYDAYFAVGYVHAQERLWQMELMRRAGQGKLAEVLGEPALNIDKMFRTIGIWKMTPELLAELSQETRDDLQAYADGVNRFIEISGGKLPVEFDLLDITPEPWQPEHSVLISRLMAWELNYSRWVDVTLGNLVEVLGVEKAREIFPDWPEGAPTILPDEIKGKKIAQEMRELLDADRNFRSLIGTGGLESGSNAWVVSGSKTVSGKPLLANDPHLLFSNPGRWYDLHLVAPGLDVQGVTLAGVPFVVIGRNRHIAWGVTNAMADDQDFFIEAVDSILHPSRYRFNNAWRTIHQSVDTIFVKDGAPVFLTIYRTHRGPLINRMERSAQVSKHLISMRWVGHDPSAEIETFRLLNRALNKDDFEDALKYYSVPAQNFVYADVDGNIGYRMGGRIPIRKGKGPTLPFPGSTDEYDWKGYVPFEQMPRLFNPPQGFIAIANNKIVSNAYPYYISNLWEPHWRIERITEVLQSEEQSSVESFQKLQLDVVSIHARELVPIILQSYATQPPPEKELQVFLNYFRNWKYEMRVEDVATTIFHGFINSMIRNTFEDEMGREMLALYDTLASVPLNTLTRMMKKGKSPWFDDVKTPGIETMNDMIHKSMREVFRDLHTQFGGEIKEWRWGIGHTVIFPHAFSGHPLLRPVFTIGPFPTGGSFSTVNKGDYWLAAPFGHSVGPSTRQIFDLADVNNGRAVTPPGQCGQVFSKHYDDQVSLWLAGSYRKTVMDREVIDQAQYSILRLEPKR
ncbi:MAG: penicillin acylase family protein [bacterium]